MWSRLQQLAAIAVAIEAPIGRSATEHRIFLGGL
jgi:hypothetical protein